jgi:hypothetical protein
VRRALVLGLTVLAGVLAPAVAAPAATLAPIKPCYVSAGQADDAREQISIMAQSFTPNATATVAIDGAPLMTNAQVDPLGTISGSIAAPFQASGQRPFTLSITENQNAANTVSAQSLVSALGVSVKPANARPASRVRFRGRGFTGGPSVYGHYLRKGRLRKTVLLASTSGPCGTFDVRRRQLPVKHPHRGRWILQIDQDATWRAEPQSVRVLLVIDVTPALAGRS